MSAPINDAEVPSVREVLSETDETQLQLQLETETLYRDSMLAPQYSKPTSPRNIVIPTSSPRRGGFAAGNSNSNDGGGGDENNSKSEKENSEQAVRTGSHRTTSVTQVLSQDSVATADVNQEAIGARGRQVDELTGVSGAANNSGTMKNSDDIMAQRRLWSPQSSNDNDESSSEGIPSPTAAVARKRAPSRRRDHAPVERKLESPDIATTRTVSPKVGQRKKKATARSARGKGAIGPPKKAAVKEEKNDPLTFSDVMEDLAAKIFQSAEPSPGDVKRLMYILIFAFPQVQDRAPTASTISQIMFEAKHLNLELEATQRLLDLFQALHDKDMAPSDERAAARSPSSQVQGRQSSVSNETILEFVKSLVTVSEDDRKIPAVFSGEDLKVSVGDQAIEIDLKDGFVDRKLTQIKSGEEPWWEIVARLQGQEIDRNDSNLWSQPHSSNEETVDRSFGSSELGSMSANEVNKSFGSSELGSGSANEVDKGFGSELGSGSANEEVDKRFDSELGVGFANNYGYDSPDTFEVLGLYGSYYPGEDGSSTWGSGKIFSTDSGSSMDTYEESWILRRSMAHWSKKGVPELWHKDKMLNMMPVSEPERINAVKATERLFTLGAFRCGMRDGPRLSQQWKRTYKNRIERHKGYHGAHIGSLCKTSYPSGVRHELDDKPWERRTVKQHFLYEKSVSVSRNWFGSFQFEECKPMVGHIPVQVESIPMPMEANWAEDWYLKPWPQPLDTNLSGCSSDSKGSKKIYHSDVPSSTRSVGPYASPFNYPNDDNNGDESLMHRPECGSIQNTKLKIGERITLLTPDITCSLRSCQWRKKHFPRGTFPY